MGIIKDFDKIEKAIKDGATDKNTYISNTEIYNAYTMCFFKYYDNYNSDIDSKETFQKRLPNNLLSPATILFQDLVASKVSLFFNQFPEWKTNDEEIEGYLDENKEKFENFFYKAIENYVLYGNVAVFLNDENELELVTNNFQCVGRSLILGDRKIEEKSKKLIRNQRN